MVLPLATAVADSSPTAFHCFALEADQFVRISGELITHTNESTSSFTSLMRMNSLT